MLLTTNSYFIIVPIYKKQRYVCSPVLVDILYENDEKKPQAVSWNLCVPAFSAFTYFVLRTPSLSFTKGNIKRKYYTNHMNII